MSNFENENDFLAGLKAEFEPAGNKSSNDFLAGLKDEFEPKKPQDGMWETTKAFGRDLAKVPSEISSGFGTTTDQMRMFGNFVQGDREELESLYNGLKNYAPLPESETTVGSWVRGAANTLPYMGMSAAAGIGGGFAGGAAGSVVPFVGNVAGATTGAALGSASVGFAQGWGEMYGRLRNEGIDHDTAAGIALAVAPVYAGIEAVQVRKIPGVAQLVDKYLGAPFKRMLATRLADKAFKNKVAKALGSYAGEIISQSAEEGAQEMAMNTGEQYARNDGFKNFDIGENLAAGTEVFKESVGPFAVMQAGNVPINAVLNRRAKRLQQDISNVQNAVEEGRKSATEEGTPAPIKKPTSAPDGGIDVGGLSNLEADAANDEIDLQNTAQKNLENPDGKKETSAQSGLDRAQAAALFMQNLQNDPMNVPQGLGLQQEEALLEFMKMRAKLATVQAEKARAEQAKAQEEARLDELAEESLTEAQFERAKENTAKKLADLKPKTNRVAARIERITDPAQRLTAIKEAYEQGNLEKLTDGQLESAWENGADWAEKELSRRTETQNSGTPLLQVMKENGFKLPTPAAIKRHAQANGRGLSSYTFGEINDLYNSLPANQRLRYFTKNYVNLDETAQSLKKFGFKYDSEGDFISDVADNLSGQRLSYGFSLAENDFGKMTDAELVEAHRKAEAAKDYSAGFEIKKEWDRRRGYNRDLYHGSPTKNITEFRDESYFTEDKNYARRYKKGEDGRIYEVRANLKKPFDTRNPKEREIFEKEFYGKWGNGTPLGERGLPDWTDGSDLWEFLQEKGYNYDSMVLDEGGDGGYGDNVKWRGESYVPIKSSAVKLRDAFTYGDDGEYIPLDKRSDASNPDIRYSIGEDDARRFKSELQDYIDGKLDNRHVFKLGTTPEVMRLVGADDLPVELSASVLERKEAKHSLILENLANLPEELADPIAVMQSSTIPDAITLITELPTLDRHNMLVAIHLNKRFGKAEINSIRSIYPKTQNGIQAAIERGELRYINTKRKPSWITLPFQHASGRKVIQRAYGHEVFTQADLSQAEKENIFKLRGENEKHAYSISERGNEKQAKIDEIKTAVEEVLEKFNRRAKIKSDVSVVGTLDEARAELGAESIPYNARAVQSGDKVVIIAENITDTDEAVRIFLHEQVGHWGLHKLLKADLRPFLNYVILNYKGSEAWNRIAKYYGNVASDKYVIAEEMLAHIAENRELSDPSMWKRLVHKVKRELWGNGVPQEYVNLLNEDVLRAAIALSREWAKGDHYLNANGIWAKIESASKGRDVPDEPDDGKRFSLVGEKGMQNLENIGSKSASNPESAKEMSERGETPSNIWRKTGWFKNPKDGKWRYELDNGEIINAPFNENSNQLLPNVLDDSELYLAYPNLKNRWVAFRNIANGGAYFDGKNFYVDNSFAENPKGLREILIHEIQHSIQIEEGFAQGANEAMFTSENSKLLNWKIEEVSREYKQWQAERKLVCDSSGLSDKIRAIADDEDFVEKYKKLLEESGVDNLLSLIDGKIAETGEKLWKLEEERDRLDNEETGLSPHEKYMRVAGEVEARNAAARQRQLSPDMRRRIFPEATQDIPFDEQIVRRNDGVSYSLEEEAEDSDAEKINRQFRELYERYKDGDKPAYEEAAKMVAEYAESKGYDVRVYHGTGANGFNVAKADASEAKNGEGHQAHGMGLYLATSKNTSERYKKQAIKAQKLVYFDHEKYEHVQIPFDKLNEKTQGVLAECFDDWRGKTLDELEELLRDYPQIIKRLSADNEKFGDVFLRGIFESAKAEFSALKEFIPYIKNNKLDPAFFATQKGDGKVFDWFTDLKPNEVLDENKPLSEQPEIWKKFKNAWIDMWAYVKRKRKGKRYWEWLNPDRLGKDGSRTAGFIFTRWSDEYGSDETINLLLRNGIRGITYDGRLDGRCYVSFEGGEAVKLQDPFTFDDNGELIPLTERFDAGNPDMRYSIREEDEWATNKKEWDNISFARQVDSYAKGDYPSGKFFTVGTPSALLKSFGIPDNKIVMTEGVLKKIKTHGLSDVQIKQIPEAINSPVGIFSYPKNENVFDVLVEMHMDDGRPIIVSLEINKNRQGLGEITDLLTAHPKENFGRIVDWAKKGRCKYWNKQKGRKLLQDTIPADWERYETELTPYLPLQSEINDERQGKYSLKEKTPEKYDGRFGDANRKYTRLLGQKKRELGREISYEELPNVATDEEFEKAVGMSKQAFGDLMKERDKMGADMAYEYQKTDQRAKQATVDRFNPIKVVEMFINGGEAFGAEKSAYKSLLAAGNMDAVMYNAIYVGLPKYNRKKGQWEVREGTKPLIAYFDKVKGDKYDNFENYANAVAMLEHYKREHKLETISDAYKWADDKEFEAMSGFSKQQAKKWMEEATKDSKDTVKALQEFFAANREFMVETGLASRAQADVLNSFEYYLPMLREFDENDSIMSGDGSGYRSRGFSGRSSGVKNFTGSRRKTKNVMESIIERTAALYANGYKNIAMQRSIQMLSEFGLARHAEKSSEIVKARISCAKAALEKAGVQVGEVHDESELIPLEAFHITNSLDERIRDDIVSVRANGRLIFYKINDPELLVALKSLGQDQMNVLTQWLIGAKNVMTWGVTKLPAFAIRNFLRDTGANAVLLGNNPIKSVANFAKALKDTPQMQNIRMSGFGGAVWYPVSAKGVSTDFGGGAWKKTKRVGKYVLKPFEAYERVLQASEQANRITAYDRAIADGVSEAEAAYRANDVLPFNMRGSGVWTGKNNYAKSGIQILSWLIRVSPFVNAGIQGLFKAYREMGIEQGMFNAKDEFDKRAKMRELAKSLNKGLMARGALLAALSVAYSIYTNSSTDDDGEKWYEKLPDDDKLNYWHFYTGNNTILRLPKPFEIGYLFSTIPTAMADAFLSENPDTAKILFKGLADQMRFDLTSNPAINTLKENLRNKTSFRGSPVVERSDLNLPPQMQYSADTSATAKALSIIPSMLPLLKDSWAASPARVQNALNNFFGGMSQYGTYATDAILQSFTDIEQPTSRYARISPITRAYDWATRDTKTMRVKNSEVFYELKNRVDELYAAARMYRQTGQLERLDTLMDTHKSEFGNYELINALNTQLREIATKRRKLGETKSYSTAELIELDNKLLAERNQLLQKVDTIIERIERGEYRPRDLREVTKRIDRSAAVKKDSQKARMLMRQLE